MEYMTVKEAAEKWDLYIRRIQYLCKDGRIPGVIRPARDWLIPKDAKKPGDRRRKQSADARGMVQKRSSE